MVAGASGVDGDVGRCGVGACQGCGVRPSRTFAPISLTAMHSPAPSGILIALGSASSFKSIVSLFGSSCRDWRGYRRTSGSRSGPIRSTSTDVVGVVTLTTTAERREVARRGRGAVSDRVSSHGRGEKQFGLSNTYAYGRACVALERPCRTAACPRPRWFARIGGIEEVRGSPHHSPPAVLRRTQPLPASRPEAAACCTDKGWAAFWHTFS